MGAQRRRLKPAATKHLKLTIAYDGTQYGGWQRQPNAVTVQELIEKALEQLCGLRFTVQGSGRTDAGVHARSQVASCSLTTRHSPLTLLRALNAQLPKDIRVQQVREVNDKFHARFSARGKEYRYQIDCGAVADPFRRRYVWHHPRPLRVGAMRRAARLLKGRHDFSALSADPMRPGSRARGTVRTISKLTVSKRGNLLTISVCADGFLYKMVRSIVGALVKVGEGKLTVEQLAELMRRRKRTALVETAPAHGLFLWQVFY
ncbi:MAG: tRNA pseudouridine(38-40) synthase TruA [Verrucomicrobiia bacterium]